MITERGSALPYLPEDCAIYIWALFAGKRDTVLLSSLGRYDGSHSRGGRGEKVREEEEKEAQDRSVRSIS